MGSLCWMAPELFGLKPAYSTASDMYPSLLHLPPCKYQYIYFLIILLSSVINRFRSLNNFFRPGHLRGLLFLFLSLLMKHIYALAVIMWEVGSRKAPYENAHQEFIAVCVKEGQREEDLEDCPPGYMELIKKCWDQDPKNRPTIDQIISTLEEIKRHLPEG